MTNNVDKENSITESSERRKMKKFYVAIFNDDNEIIRVHRLFNEDKVKEVIEENEAFGYKAERGYLGKSDKGLAWRRKGNHANRDKKNIQYVPYQLIV